MAIVDGDQVDQLYKVASDDELTMLDELTERAGLRWTCRVDEPNHPWTNDAGEKCARCKRTQQQSTDAENAEGEGDDDEENDNL